MIHRMKYNLMTWLIAAIVGSCSSQVQQELTVAGFEKAIVQPGAQVLDVRTAGEYAEGHLQHALQADWTESHEFSRRVAALDPAKPVYIYCLSGGRSTAAQQWMLSHGFKEVYNLRGGINAWRQEGRTTEGDVAGPQLSISDLKNRISPYRTVLVDIGAAWCPPCRNMEPIVDSLAHHAGSGFGVVKIDGGKNTALAGQLRATTFPTFIVYRNGQEVWRHEGMISYGELLKQLQ